MTEIIIDLIDDQFFKTGCLIKYSWNIQTLRPDGKENKMPTTIEKVPFTKLNGFGSTLKSGSH